MPKFTTMEYGTMKGTIAPPQHFEMQHPHEARLQEAGVFSVTHAIVISALRTRPSALAPLSHEL
jgi:hypothetical protein